MSNTLSVVAAILTYVSATAFLSVMRPMAVALALGLLTGCNGDSPTVPTGVPTPPPPLVLLNSSGVLDAGYQIFVNTDRQRTDWLSTTADGLHAEYPSGQQFGFVAIVLRGETALGNRPSVDLSSYMRLQVQLRGAVGGEIVQIGIKDNTDPDTGEETKIAVTLSSSWETRSFSLSEFTTADLESMYLAFELVFEGNSARSVFFRDVQYLP